MEKRERGRKRTRERKGVGKRKDRHTDTGRDRGIAEVSVAKEWL